MNQIQQSQLASNREVTELAQEIDLAATRAPLSDARHLPPHFYTAPEILAQEMEKLFFRDWLAVGRVEEFPNPGDYRAAEFLDEPIIICRNAAGDLKPSPTSAVIAASLWRAARATQRPLLAPTTRGRTTSTGS